MSKKLWTVMFFFFLITSACKNDMKKLNEMFQERNSAIETGDDVELIYSDSGRVVLKLVADKMVRHLDPTRPRQEFPMGVMADFYDKEGSVTSYLIADYAIRDESNSQVVARENVILYNLTGDTLRTDELIWDQADENIYSDQFVRISTPKEILYGFGFRTDPSFNTFHLSEISGRMELENLPDGNTKE